MNVNTTTGKLKLTKTERVCLDKAAKIVGNIAKHADGPTQEAAEVACDELDKMLASMVVDETVVEV